MTDLLIISHLWTTNIHIINNCPQYFDVKLPSTLWSDRVKRYEKKFAECGNIFLQNFSLDSIAYVYLFWLSFYSVCFSVFFSCLFATSYGE